MKRRIPWAVAALVAVGALAMTETPIPVEFDTQTLAAAGVPYKPPGHLSTAHPHLDRAKARLGTPLQVAPQAPPENERQADVSHRLPDAGRTRVPPG